MSVIKVENLIKNYKKSTWKESEEDVKVLKEFRFRQSRVNLSELWENPVVEKQHF